MTPPLLPLEEHFFTTPLPPALLPKLTDLSALRRRDMAAGGVTLQVISHAPGLGEYPAAVCRAANDQLAEANRRDVEDARGEGRGRGCFAGFAAVPMGEPAEAVVEVRRAVRELGFVGVMVDNHCRGRFYEGGGRRWRS
jgi:predicted TIM-barrel fold metal-dependent hydrolase